MAKQRDRIFLNGGYDLYQDSELYRFSLDSVLLSDFVKIKPKQKVIELGCGNGAVLLMARSHTDDSPQFTGIEIQKENATLAQESIELNNLNNITIINADLRGIHKTIGANNFDVVLFNPPYFEEGRGQKKDNISFATARHEGETTLEDYVKESQALIQDSGKLFVVYRAESLVKLIMILEKYHFGAKTIRFVYTKEDDNEALLVLVEAAFHRISRLKVLPSLYINKGNTKERTYTDEAYDILNGRQK